MNGVGLAILIIVMLCWICLFTWLGVEKCKQNNAIGIVYLFLGLGILGLIIGLCMIYNNKNKN